MAFAVLEASEYHCLGWSHHPQVLGSIPRERTCRLFIVVSDAVAASFSRVVGEQGSIGRVRPGIDDRDGCVGEVVGIPGGEGRSVASGYRCDLCVGGTHGPSQTERDVSICVSSSPRRAAHPGSVRSARRRSSPSSTPTMIWTTASRQTSLG